MFAVRPSKLQIIFAASVLALGAGSLRAQQVKADGGMELEEIVVTATKRASTVQNTPISITAIGGEELRERGITDVTSVVQSVPGISLRTSGPGQTELEMRGMASVSGNSSTVGFYLDDTPLNAPANAQNGKVVIDPNLYDLNRVEVLRGPQGTLYGSGSMGGTVKLVPNPPDPKAFGLSAEVVPSYTDGAGFNRGENAMVNVPFADGTAALRVVASELHNSGWIDRIVIAEPGFPLETNQLTKRGNVLAAPVANDYRHVNDEELKAFRASILWKPLDQLTITPFVMYQRISQNGLDQIDSDPGTDAHYQPFDDREPYTDRFSLASLNVQYGLPWFDVTSNTSRWDRHATYNQDGTEEFQWAFSTPSALLPFYVSQGGIGATSPTPVEDDRSDQTSEELRLTSKGNGPVTWLVGFFYSKFGSCYCTMVLIPGAAPGFGTQNAFTEYQNTYISQNAAFGEVSYQWTDSLKSTVGLRRYNYHTTVDAAVSGFVSPSGSDDFLHLTSPERNQGVNPKLDLSYQPNKDLLLYGTVSKGFRPGGGNQPVPTTGLLGSVCEADLQANHGTASFVQAPLAFGPDSVWSYELGEKTRLWEQRVTLNSALYFEKWNGTQQTIPLACGYNYTDNSGTAHVYGAEVELTALVLPGLIFSANGAYTHATFVVGSLEAGITPGTRVQAVPEHTASFSLAYRHDLVDGLVFASRLENDFVGRRTDATYTINDLDGYDLTNMRVGVERDHWSAMLFAHNLTNERVILDNAFQLNINIPTFNRAVLSQPLTLGLDLSYHY
ncbi:MAG TPA: TonB-dependent receptor [Steroidobacteraceae bacterium]|jgi:outer membrane receptor protein involved in Fe transport|nr:TonB-dependent receptor [Steroidobacteraceae bacterium]